MMSMDTDALGARPAILAGRKLLALRTISYRNQGSRGPTMQSGLTMIARALSGAGRHVERRDLEDEARMREIVKKIELGRHVEKKK
jgi:hypothetical protein